MDKLDKNIIEQVVRIVSDSLQENGWAQQANVCLKCKKAGINTKVLGNTSNFFAAMEDYIEKDIDNNNLPILRLKKYCQNPYIKTYQEIGELNKGWKNFDKYVEKLISSGIANDEDEIKKELLKLAPHVKFFNKEYKIDGASTCRAFRANELVPTENIAKKQPTLSSANSLRNEKLSAYDKLMKFAYFPKKDTDSSKNGFQQAIEVLANEKVLKEDWSYKDNDTEDYPILKSYLLRTFERLQSEDEKHSSDEHWSSKIRYSKDGNYVVFNTGLVDSLFEPVYAFFKKNIRREDQWLFVAFIKSNDKEHQTLTRIFGTELPAPAHYYDNTSELVYNIKEGIGTYNWDHIIERCDRLPVEFLRDNGPSNFDYNDVGSNDFFKRLSEAILNDSRSYNRIKNRILDAVDYAVKRVRWNYKTAIPVYFPSSEEISLLLPLSLVNEEKIDVALVLEATQSGAYIAHTILTLKMAYNNARLITRPDSDWLIAKNITSKKDSEEEQED